MKDDLNATDYLRTLYPEEGAAKEFGREVTFQLGEDCTLRCFPAGTKILMKDFSYKNIEDISVGDELLTFEKGEDKKQLKFKITKVTHLFKHESLTRTLIGADGSEIETTDEHPFYTHRRKWRRADKCSPVSTKLMKFVGAPTQKVPESKDYMYGYIIGAWMGDGTICYYKNGELREPEDVVSHNSRFVVNDWEITDRVSTYLTNIGIKNYIKYRDNDKLLMVSGRAVNKQFTEFIEKNFSNNSHDFLCGYLAGMIDTEGNVNGHIRIANTNIRLLRKCMDALEILGYHYHLEDRGPSPNYPHSYCLEVMCGKNARALHLVNYINIACYRKKVTTFYDKSYFKRCEVVSNVANSTFKPVYNLETGAHTFIANDYLVHNCTYCYQYCKSKKAMTWEVAKKCVDMLFKMWDDDVPGAFINKNTKQIILDFIGGEPLLYIDLMEKIVEYFWNTAISRRHPWAENFMISMASNGTLYFDEKVQRFLDKYRNHMSFSVSIDGPKDMHDACRVFPDGTGSFDLAEAAQDDFNRRYYHTAGTKATIARGNLPYLDEIIKYYVSKGYTQLHANCVYEEEWNNEDAALFYEQCKKIADYILSLDGEVEIALFEEHFFHPKDPNDLQNWCGGTGAMLAFDPDGKCFPCIRYMHSSLNDDQEPLCIGDCETGLYNTPETKAIGDLLNSIDRRSQSTDECFNCPIAEGCSWCLRGDTLIDTPKGSVPINSLSVGDVVLDNDGNPQQVSYVHKRRDPEPIYLLLENGLELYTTGEHPILTETGFVNARDLAVHDKVNTTCGYSQIIKKDTDLEPYEVYNLSVENTHTFIANSIKVHNCSGWNYQLYGTPDKRCTRICPMHKSRSLANTYYWNKYYLKNGIKKSFFRYLPDSDALEIIDQDELNLLNELEKETRDKMKMKMN